MATATMAPEIGKPALIIVDMQNDFVHPDGGFACIARETPEAGIDMPFLMGTIPNVRRLADAFREAGRPVIYIAHVVKPDFSDAQLPYWRSGLSPNGNRTFIAEGTWGAQIVDDLKPEDGRAPGRQEGLRRVFEHTARHHPAQYGRDDMRCVRRDNLRLRVVDRTRRGRAQLSHDPGEGCGRRGKPRHP